MGIHNLVKVKVGLLAIIIAFSVTSCYEGRRPQGTPQLTMTPNETLESRHLATTEIVANTPTTAATMSSEERADNLLKLIQQPGDCRLPCWWGIQPGVSTWQQAQEFVSRLGFGNFDLATSDQDDLRFDLEKLQLYQNLSIERQDNLVSQITISVDGMYKLGSLQAVWDSYAPERILALYGKPSRISLQVAFGDQAVYNLFLFYDEDGFLILYGGMASVVGEDYRVCPVFRGQEDIDSIDFFLQDPVSIKPLEGMFSGYELLMPVPQSLQGSVGLSIEQFMELAHQDIFCFDTARTRWR